MFRFIHTADIHLDSPLLGLETYDDAPVEEIRGAARRAFEKLIGFAVEEQIDFMLIAGDLYDGDWKDYNTGLFFARQMGILHNANIPVFIVSGNHDAASKITRALPLPDNVTLFSARSPQSKTVADIQVIIHGQSYKSQTMTENLAAGYPVADNGLFNIGLLHTSLNGRAGHANYAPCTVRDLEAKGYDYWALGHVHTREIISKDPMIVFPGNIQGRHIKETGAKGATLVTVEHGQVSKVEHHDFDVLRWAGCRVDLSTCDTAADIHDLVRSAIAEELDQSAEKPVALRLTLQGPCPLHTELHGRSSQWTEEFRSIAASLGNVWLETVKYQTSPMVSLAEMMAEDTPIAGLLQTIEKFKDNEESLTNLIPELAVLKTKLPGKLQDLEIFVPGNASKSLVQDVNQLLIGRFMQQGEK